MFPSLSQRQLVSVSLGLLALLSACEKRSKGIESVLPPPSPQSPTVEAGPRFLNVTVQSVPPILTALSEDHRAQVNGETGWTYEWSLVGGRITSGWSGSEVTYTAGEPGEARLTCAVRDASGRTGSASILQTIVAPPSLGLFEATPSVVSLGGSANLQWEAREVARLQLNPGGQDVLRLAGLQVQPTETTTYTLTAANRAGTQVRKSLTLKVVPPPLIRSFSAEGGAKVGQPLTLRADFADGKAEVRQDGTTLASSSEGPLRVQVNPKATTVYTLKVTNEGGATTSQTLTVSIPAPAK